MRFLFRLKFVTLLVRRIFALSVIHTHTHSHIWPQKQRKLNSASYENFWELNLLNHFVCVLFDTLVRGKERTHKKTKNEKRRREEQIAGAYAFYQWIVIIISPHMKMFIEIVAHTSVICIGKKDEREIAIECVHMPIYGWCCSKWPLEPHSTKFVPCTPSKCIFIFLDCTSIGHCMQA